MSVPQRIALKPGLVPGFIVLLCLSGCGRDPAAIVDSNSPIERTPSLAAPAPGPSAYDKELATLDAAIADLTRLIEQRPQDALMAAEKADALLERARLSGQDEDYVAAELALQEAERRGGDVLPPCLSSARLQFSLHRLEAARRALARCPAGTPAEEVAALIADLDFYSGRYAEAEAVYRQQVNDLGTPETYVRLARARLAGGSPGEAAALLEAAEKRYHGGARPMRAWLKLQRGLVALERGRLDEAQALYLLAQAEFPGWWLVDEHLAEVQALMGQVDVARSAYEEIVRRTGMPEFMDALAEIHLAQGRIDEGNAFIAQARSRYEARIARFPEASAGHALDHYLVFDTLSETTLQLALANHRNRPFGDAAIALARVLAARGNREQAHALLVSEREKGWQTAELLWLLGDLAASPEDTARHRNAALRLNTLSAAMHAL